jgi:hypothetical protein
MNTLKFAVNVPARVALSFPTGKPVEGQYGPQVMFSLCLAPAGERLMYVPPIVDEQIQKLGIVKGEPFQVLKAEVPNGGRPKIEWKVSKLQPELDKPAVRSQVNGHAAVNGIPYLDPKTEWLRCADDAIAALVMVREHATAKGLPVQFTGEDLRQVAATLYIDAGKTRRCPAVR